MSGVRCQVAEKVAEKVMVNTFYSVAEPVEAPDPLLQEGARWCSYCFCSFIVHLTKMFCIKPKNITYDAASWRRGHIIIFQDIYLLMKKVALFSYVFVRDAKFCVSTYHTTFCLTSAFHLLPKTDH